MLMPQAFVFQQNIILRSRKERLQKIMVSATRISNSESSCMGRLSKRSLSDNVHDLQQIKGDCGERV